MWFVGGRWGVKWVLNQAVVKKKNSSGFQNDVCLISLNESDKKKMDSFNVEVAENHEKPQEDITVEDSDEEEVVDTPPVVVDTPPVVEDVKPKKKLVKKKAPVAA